MILEFILVIIFLVVWTSSVNLNKPKNYPPGPLSLPFLGAFASLAIAGDFGMTKKLIKYGKKFGKVFSLDLGSFRCVMLNSSEAIKEVFGNAAACGRPRMETVRIVCGGNFRGLALHDGPAWKEHRQFTIKSLKDFGFGKKSLEPIIVEEAQELVKSLIPLAGQPISTHHKFNYAVVNILWTIIAGDRFAHDDPKLLHLIDVIAEATSQSNKLGIFFFPWFAINFPALSGWNRFKATANSLHQFVHEFVAVKKETYQDGIRRHFTDVYFEELGNKKRDLESSFSGKLGEENMQTVLVDLFFAGSETSSTTLSWTLLYLALNPQAQRKLQREIDEIIGEEIPSLEHRKNMPYMEAVLAEALRCSSVSQVGIPHYALEDVSVGEYEIPKGTIIFSNIYAAHHDPDVWADPFSFKPERFLSSDEKQTVRHEAFVAFSAGKRSCPGETVARDQIFIFMASIIQKFSVTIDPNAPRAPSMDAKFSLTRSPMPHKLVLTLRQPGQFCSDPHHSTRG